MLDGHSLRTSSWSVLNVCSLFLLHFLLCTDVYSYRAAYPHRHVRGRFALDSTRSPHDPNPNPNPNHNTDRTLWADQCFHAVAFKDPRLIRPARDFVGWKYSRFKTFRLSQVRRSIQKDEQSLQNIATQCRISPNT